MGSIMSNLLADLTRILVAGRDGVGVCLTCDDQGQPTYDGLQWESENVPKPSPEEFAAAVQEARTLRYRDERRAAYPTLEEQLDTLFHQGYEGWKSAVQAIKDQFPKPA